MSFGRRFRVPHVFTLLTGMVFLASLSTWVVPSGQYERVVMQIDEHDRTLVVPGTYREIPKAYSLEGALIGEQGEEGAARPVGILGFLTAIPCGLEQSADIIFFIFIIGGTFGILQRSGTIAAAVQALLDRLGHSATLVTVVLMLVIAAGGSTLGMTEEFIPLVPVFLLISSRLGYDRIYGLALVMLAAQMGFAAATTNPFTVSIAQGIAELKLGSGMGLRLVFFGSCMAVTITYVLRYGARIKADPSRSWVADLPDESGAGPGDRPRGDSPQTLTRAHVAIIVSSAAIFAGVLFGATRWGWWMAEMAGGFFLMGLVAAAISPLTVAESTRAAVRGMEEMVVAALVVGFARGIQVALVDGQILDTLIHSAATALRSVPQYVSVVGMLLFQSSLNLVIPSGSGQAAVTMPLMAPLADVLGITRQTAVLAFQFGDGLSNTIVPTSGVLMGMLALARIPYGRWLRFVLPLFLMLLLLACAFLVIAVTIGYR